MQVLPVKVGIWHDHSCASTFARDIVTLDVLPAVYLTVATSLFVGLVGSAAWSVLGSLWRLCREARHPSDPQHDLEAISPSSSAGCSWSSKTLSALWQRSNGRSHTRSRSLISTLLTVLVFILATKAGLCLIQLISGDHISEHVRVGSGRCGTFEFDSTSDGLRAAAHKRAHDAIVARSYAEQCYSQTNVARPCSLYPVPSIRYNQSYAQCPFGTDPSGVSLCDATSAPMTLDTGLLDTDHVFGVNARHEDRVLVLMSLTCSPLNTTAYTRVDGVSGLTELGFGPISGISNFTFLYDRDHAVQAAYHVSLIAKDPSSWSPITSMQIDNGDLHLAILSTNSVRYTARVKDAWFRASTPIQSIQSEARYRSDRDFAVMGCIDQLQLCNPDTFPYSCTPLGRWTDAAMSSAFIGFNRFQQATAARMLENFLLASTARTIVELGDQGLLASQRLSGIVSHGLPADQWQREVAGWFATSLARVQTSMLELVARRPQVERHGHVLTPSDQFAASFCDNQRVRNVTHHQNFSLWGLVLIFSAGMSIIVLSQVIEPSADYVRRKLSSYHEIRDDKAVEILEETTGWPRITMAEASYDNTWETLLKESQVLRLGKRFAPRKSSSRRPCYTIVEEELLISDAEGEAKQ